MNVWEMAAAGIGCYGLAVLVAWKAGWIDALIDRMNRRRKPMPPPPFRRVPIPGNPLTFSEELAWEAVVLHWDATAEDPAETPGCHCGHGCHPDRPCSEPGCGCQVNRPKAAA